MSTRLIKDWSVITDGDAYTAPERKSFRLVGIITINGESGHVVTTPIVNHGVDFIQTKSGTIYELGNRLAGGLNLAECMAQNSGTVLWGLNPPSLCYEVQKEYDNLLREKQLHYQYQT